MLEAPCGQADEADGLGIPRMPEGPRTEAPKTRPRGRRHLLATLFLVVIFLVGTIACTAVRSKPGQDHTKVAAATPAEVNSDDFIRLKGTTVALASRTILAPVVSGQQASTLTVTRLAAGGSRVHRGDLLVEFDRQAQTRDFLDKQADYQKLADQVVEEQAKELATRAKDETELKAAEDSLSNSELEMQKLEILSRINAERAQESLDESRATVEQLRQTFDLKRSAARAAIRILEIQRDRAQQTMLHVQANAELMQIRSPLDGIVVLNTIWKQGKIGEVQEGDQIRPGVPFLQVVDPSIMEVQVLANQEDFFNLQVGQVAKIHLDAYPELTFAGKLEQIAPVARGGDFSSKLNTFAVTFSMQGNDDKLMPDLSAAVDVEVRGTRIAAGGSR